MTTTNELPNQNNGPVEPSMPYVAPPQSAKPVKKPPHVYTKPEFILLPISILIGILFDKLIFMNVVDVKPGWALLSGIFWLCYLIIFYCFNWAKLKRNTPMWIVAGFTLSLCLWNVIFDYNSVFGRLTFVLIPGVCMAHSVFTGSGYKLKQIFALIQEWLLGWFVKPFVAIPHFFGVGGVLFSKEKNSTLKRAIIGIVISVCLLMIILPLLAGADKVFGFYISKIFRDFSLPRLIGQIIVTFIASILFFSFLWNIRFKETEQLVKINNDVRIDMLIISIILGMVLIIYALFCAVQFTYLFAGAGLPEGMTYSEYAREGFWQLIVVSGINLLLFGIFLCFGTKGKLLYGMLAGLLAVTGIMMISGAVRLNLYVITYGLTWLRLISAWFILFIAGVIILCGVRMFIEKIPLFAVCAFVLLGWYTVLGYSNPDAQIIKYNLARAENPKTWVEKNKFDLKYNLSDDAILALIEAYPDVLNTDDIDFKLLFIQRASFQNEGISLSSNKLREVFKSNNIKKMDYDEYYQLQRDLQP